jgi:hypothetical protein
MMTKNYVEGHEPLHLHFSLNGGAEPCPGAEYMPQGHHRDSLLQRQICTYREDSDATVDFMYGRINFDLLHPSTSWTSR